MEDKILKSLIKNFEEDFGMKLPGLTQYCEFEKQIYLRLEEKAKLGQINEEKLKTVAKLTSLKKRDFWKEISHSLSFVSIVNTIILAIGDITNKPIFTVIALVMGIAIFPFVLLIFPCSKYIAREIHYYEYKLKLIRRFFTEQEKNKYKITPKKQVLHKYRKHHK